MEPADLPKIFDEIDEKGFRNWLVEALTNSFKTARLAKRTTCDEHEFEVNWAENIVNLAKTIEERTYEPGSSIAFVVFDPMVREIFAAPFRDRSVHHLIYDITAGWMDQDFIPTSTSCRKGKGTLWAIKEAQRQMIEVTENCTKKARVVKLDIKGYFMSISREKLLKVLS